VILALCFYWTHCLCPWHKFSKRLNGTSARDNNNQVVTVRFNKCPAWDSEMPHKITHKFTKASRSINNSTPMFLQVIPLSLWQTNLLITPMFPNGSHYLSDIPPLSDSHCFLDHPHSQMIDLVCVITKHIDHFCDPQSRSCCLFPVRSQAHKGRIVSSHWLLYLLLCRDIDLAHSHKIAVRLQNHSLEKVVNWTIRGAEGVRKSHHLNNTWCWGNTKTAQIQLLRQIIKSLDSNKITSHVVVACEEIWLEKSSPFQVPNP
jgi:hypothetical protein